MCVGRLTREYSDCGTTLNILNKCPLMFEVIDGREETYALQSKRTSNAESDLFVESGEARDSAVTRETLSTAT